jgi:hypothetical protein
MYGTIKSFNEISASDVETQLSEKIKKEIERQNKEYILEVDEEEYKKHLVNEFEFEPLIVFKETETIEKPKIHKEVREVRENPYFRGHRYEAEAYIFIIKYQYSGSSELFKVQPNPWTMTSADIYVSDNYVSFSFKMYNKSKEEFEQEKQSWFRRAFTNLEGTNKFATEWNSKLMGIVSSHFQRIKHKYLEENDFFAAINVKVNENTKTVFTVPTVKKRIVPQPAVSKNKVFSSEPAMSTEMYEDVLKVIYESGKNMEKKPRLYQNKDEEGLRDQFLLFLETRYDGTTATGETFNRTGKTDMLLKYAQDSSNLFVGECKFWRGASEFLKAISQLLSYLTWRDSKTALIIFVQNKEFTNVLQTIETEIKKHPNYVSEKGKRGETSFRYLFNLPQDKEKHIFLEVIAFHFDK